MVLGGEGNPLFFLMICTSNTIVEIVADAIKIKSIILAILYGINVNGIKKRSVKGEYL